MSCDDDVLDAFDYAAANGLEVFVLGGGSNILVSDAGFDGLVIQIALQGIAVSEPQSQSVSEPPAVAGGLSRGERETVEYRDNDVQPPATAGGPDTTGLVTVTARAGEDWDAFVRFCVDRNLAGLECLSGIPGFVGGTPVQNVGAYGQDVSESIVSVRCYDRLGGQIVDLTNTECGFTYRTSIFNSTQRGRYVVVDVTYQLQPGGAPKIAYKDLIEHFGGRLPTLVETRESVLEIRRAKSMVIDAGDPNCQSAGSFFKNPIVDTRTFEQIASACDKVPNFPAGEGRVKIPAAWLIEQAGFQKGYRLGNAGISTKHSLALINCGGASAAEIIALKEKIQDGVVKKFDILLQPEPVFIAFN